MIQLSRAVQALQTRFGTSTAAPYVPGKTQFRDALCEEFNVSQADAEVVCDSLEKGGGLVFSRSTESGPLWTIHVEAIRDEPR